MNSQTNSKAQETTVPEPIYEEEKIPAYSLPDPLRFEDGRVVETVEDWKERRKEILSFFESEVYGKTPIGKPPGMRIEKRKELESFLDGKARLEEVRIWFSPGESGPFLDLLIIKPSKPASEPLPAVLALNFSGNHSIHASPEITLSGSWMRMSKSSRENGWVVDNRATEKSRGSASSRWPLETIVESGVALAVFYYGDIDPDFDDGFENGIHQLFGKPKDGDWGSIGSWAWGASRAMDYLETDASIDRSRVAVMGHSRLGKTALWAGAQDERFALVISNNSGCGGAALSRRRFGESVARINTSFPHWFCDNFLRYNSNESELPVDQHQLISLIAPRKVYVASAEEDRWADPKGEFLSCFHASPVFGLFGKEGIPSEEMPPNHQPVGGQVIYHIRAGKHDVIDYDWQQYLTALLDLDS